MARRRKRRSTKGNKRLGRRLLAVATVVFVLIVVGGFIVLLSLRSYLHSDKFRGLVSEEVSEVFNADGEFSDFQWTGMTAYTDLFSAKGYRNAVFSRARADSIRASVNFGAVWHRVWEITDIDVNRLNVLITQEEKSKRDAARRPEAEKVDDLVEESGEGWLSAFFPKRVEVKRAGIAELNFDYRADNVNIYGRGTVLEIKPTTVPGIYRVVAGHGSISKPGQPTLDLDGAEIRAGKSRVIIDRAAFSLFGNSRLGFTGEVGFPGDNSPMLDLKAVLRNVPAKEILPEDWVKRLKGIVEADVDINGMVGREGSEGVVMAGEARLKDGVFEAMPILDRIDEMLGSSRFRRLSFNDFKVNFKRQGKITQIEDYYILSSGTACLKGRAVLSDDANPVGIYMLGITPDVIKWLPLIKKSIVEEVFSYGRDEAFAIVFDSSQSSVEKPPEGFRWAVCRINPEAPDPFTADIREQFLSRGGLALWAELAGAGERGLQAIGLLVNRARGKGVDLMTLLANDGEEGEGGLLGNENLMRVARELDVESAMRKILGGLVEGVSEIPGTLLRTGTEILDGLIP